MKARQTLRRRPLEAGEGSAAQDNLPIMDFISFPVSGSFRLERGFVTRFDIPDLVACFASRSLLVVSAAEDVFSFDADKVVDAAKVLNPDVHLEHKRYQGGHTLTQERFDAILNWLVECAGGN